MEPISAVRVSRRLTPGQAQPNLFKMRDEFDLGDHAEGCFDIWCREVGVVATPPRKDKGGWDFHVVLPGTSPAGLDTPPKLNCSVQVKGQWEDTRKPPKITLSNWERMVSEPIPWFVCVVLYGKDKKPTRCALIHVDEQCVEKAAKRIWENTAGKRRDLSTLEMRVQWKDADMLEKLDGETLLAAIRMHIGDTEAYVREKIRWRQEAGVRGAKHTIQVTMREADDDVYYGKLAALALGDLTEIPVSEVTAFEIRFDLPVPRETFEDVVITLKRPPPVRIASIRFTTTKPLRESFDVLFEVRTTTQVFPFLPQQYRHVRFEAPFLRLDAVPGSSGMTSYQWRFDVPGEIVPLSGLVQAARAARALLDTSAPPPQLRIDDSEPIDLTAAPATFDPGAKTTQMLEAVRCGGEVARVFGLAENVLVTASQLLRQSEQLSLYAGIFAGSTADMRFTTKDESDELNGKRIAHVVVPGLQIGNSLLFLVIGMFGEAVWTSEDGGRIEVPHPGLRVLERAIASEEDAKKKGFYKRLVRPLVERGVRTMEAEGFEVIGTKEDP